MNMLETALKSRWQRLLLKAGANPEMAKNAFERLCWHYNDVQRHYHNLAHIDFCLGIFDTVKDFSADPISLELAIWYHDIIYDTHRSDNEERSAQYADMEILRLLQPTMRGTWVANLILATKHDGKARDPEKKLLCDIDLAGLAQPWGTFVADSENIRSEYHWVFNTQFKQVRAGILQSFYDRKPLYYLPHFQERYEEAAKVNLVRMITELRA